MVSILDSFRRVSTETDQAQIDTMGALYVMLSAQVGPDRLATAPYPISDFRVIRQPQWEPGEEYVPPISFGAVTTGGPTLVPYPFS